MAEIVLDLSGQTGLADNFFGDSDSVTPNPNERLAKGQGDIASGLFNPYLRTGYLAPSTTTNIDLTLDTPAVQNFNSVEFDHLNQLVYWGDTTKNIYVGSGLTDDSLLLEAALDFTAGGVQDRFFKLSDLQMYQLNGAQKLFYSGLGTHAHSSILSSQYPLMALATIPTANDSVWGTIAINPSGTTQPAIVTSAREYQATSSTTLTYSFAVPSGSNLCLTVFAFNSSGQTVNTISWNGTNLTSVAGNGGTNSSIQISRLVAPAAGTFNIVVTYSAASTDRLIYAIVTDNTDATNPARAVTNTSNTATTINTNKRIISDKQLTLHTAFSDEVLTFFAQGLTPIYNTTNTYGSDGLFSELRAGMYLQVGWADLPLTTVTNDQVAWYSGFASGGKLEIVYTDYAFMRVADNGFMYIFADNKVHKVDGTITGGATGTLTRNVLLFPDYFRLTDAVDYRSRLYMAVHQYPLTVTDTTTNTFTGKCGLYVWNRVSTQLTGADYIELPGVREIKKIFASPDGQLKIITISDSGIVQLRQFGYNDSGGVVFPVIKTLGIGAYPQMPDGLTTAGDKVMWLANDGKVYCNKEKYVTQLYQAKTQGSTTATLESNITSGAVFYGNGDETSSNGFRSNKQKFVYSYLDGSTHVLEKIYPFDLTTGTNSNQTPSQGDVYTSVHLIPVTSVVRNVRIYNLPISGSGTDVIATVKLYFNQKTTATHPSGMTKSVTKDEAKRGYVDFKMNEAYIHAIQVEVEWASGTPIGADMYLPSVAIITHDETTTQSPDNG